MSRTYQNQFPADYDVPQEIVVAVKDGKLFDYSWGNDVCPKFCTDRDMNPGSLVLWSDHPDPDQREISGPRFCVAIVDEEGIVFGGVGSSENVNDILLALSLLNVI